MNSALAPRPRCVSFTRELSKSNVFCTLLPLTIRRSWEAARRRISPASGPPWTVALAGHIPHAARGGLAFSTVRRRPGTKTEHFPTESTMGHVEFNPMDPEFIEDPYPTYHLLRSEDPVHHNPLGFWVLTRYDDVVAALRDPRLVKEPIAAFVAARTGAPAPAGGLSMLDRDPPDHTRLRGLVNKAFTPRVVEKLRPDIQDIVD